MQLATIMSRQEFLAFLLRESVLQDTYPPGEHIGWMALMLRELRIPDMPISESEQYQLIAFFENQLAEMPEFEAHALILEKINSWRI